MLHQRLKNLQKTLRKKRIKAFWVIQPENILYLTNYSQDLKLLITPTKGYIITDPRSAGMLRQKVKNFEVVEIVSSSGEVLSNLIKKTKARTLYTEDGITVAGLRSLAKKCKHVKSLPSPITELRLVKDSDEIKKIKQAVKITSACHRYIAKTIKVGLTEKQIVWLIEKYIREHDGDGLAFPPVVAVGPNAAVPHHQPGKTKVRKGTMLLLDFGALYQGYHGDMTRTIFVGQPTPKFERIYKAVVEAQLKGVKFIQNELRIKNYELRKFEKQLDKVVRDSLAGQSLDQYFTHGTGHGVGLQIHEAPSFHQKRVTGVKLQNGMVFTIEPGVYIKGWGGVRYENDYLAQNNKIIKL